MKKKKGFIKQILVILMCIVMCALMLAGCGAGSSDNQMPQVNSKVAEALQDDDTDASVEDLKEENEIPSNGVISKAQIKTIAGKDMTVHFNGITSEGITYQWSYEAKQIQNPIEQKLLVKTTDQGLDAVKKEAGNAAYALAVTLQEMELAALPTLTLTLKESWDADKVLYCCEEDGLKKLSDVKVSSADTKDGKVTVLSFTVPKAGGTFYLVGGSTTGSSDQNSNDSKNDSEKSDTTVQNKGADTTDNSTDADSKTDSKTKVNKNTKSDQNTSSSDKKSEEKKLTCTISIDCKAILENKDKLRSSKKDYVPKDGWILRTSTVDFEKGDTVFDVLKRVTKAAGIHMESQWTPMYDSYYVEGINQLYEFDCGANSGWMYSVNGWFPNYGCSSYEVKDGDKIEWRYTCDLGSDVGNKYMGD